MEREEFLSKMGIGVLMACAGCSLVSCGSKSTNPSPGGGIAPGTPPPVAGSGAVFTADLSSELLNVGNFKAASGVILVRIATGNTTSSFAALQTACTHEGATINYSPSQTKFICPNHGSEFSQSGQVLLGPAVNPLQKFTVTINGTTATVTA